MTVTLHPQSPIDAQEIIQNATLPIDAEDHSRTSREPILGVGGMHRSREEVCA